MGKAEGYVENYLVAQCKKHEAICMKFTSPGTNGVPDRIVVGHGLVLFVELKAPGETCRPLQVKIQDRITNHGGDVRVIDSREQVDDLMKELLDRCTLTHHDHDL